MAINTISSGVYAKVRIAYNPNQGATYIPRKTGDISAYSQTFLWDYYTTYGTLGFTNPQIFYNEYDLVTIKLGEDGLKIPLPLIECKRYNYCMMMSETGFIYYYWITGYEVLNAKTTKIYLVLDSMQTYFPCLEKFTGTLARSMPYELIELPDGTLMPNPDIASIEESPNDLTYIPTTYGWSKTYSSDYYLVTINPPDTAVFQPAKINSVRKYNVNSTSASVQVQAVQRSSFFQWLCSLWPDYEAYANQSLSTSQYTEISNAYATVPYCVLNENITYSTSYVSLEYPSFLVGYNGLAKDSGWASFTDSSLTYVPYTREAVLLMWDGDNIDNLYTTKGENYYNKYLYFLIPVDYFKQFKSYFSELGEYIISMTYVPGLFFSHMDQTKLSTLYMGEFFTGSDWADTDPDNNYNAAHISEIGYVIRDIDAFKVMSVPIYPTDGYYAISNEGSSYKKGMIVSDYDNSVSTPHLATQSDQTKLTCLTNVTMSSFFGAKFDLYPYKYVDMDYKWFTISIYTNNLYGYAYDGGSTSASDFLENPRTYGRMSVYVNFNQTPVTCNVAMTDAKTIMDSDNRWTTGWYLADVTLPSFSVNYEQWSEYENYKRALDENSIRWQTKNFAVDTAKTIASMAVSIGVNSYNYSLGSNLLNPEISGYDTRDYDYDAYSKIAGLHQDNWNIYSDMQSGPNVLAELLTEGIGGPSESAYNHYEIRKNNEMASVYANRIYADQNRRGALPGLGFKNYGSVMHGSAVSGMANSAVSGLGGIVSRYNQLKQAREQLTINQSILHMKAPTQKAYDSASTYMWKYPYTESSYSAQNYYPQSSFTFYEIKGTEKENLMQKYHVYGYATPFNLGVVNINDSRYDEIFYSRMYRNFVQFETIDFIGWGEDIPLPTQDILGDMLSRFVNGVNFVHLQDIVQPYNVDMDVATLMRGNLEYPNQCLYVTSEQPYLADGVLTSMAEYESLGNYDKE